jgi:5-methylcytosine-specific restriction endonuclease McrA
MVDPEIFQAYRDRVMKEFKHRCGRCVTSEAVCVHEIIPRSLYPEWVEDHMNGIPLCNPCHQWATDNPDESREDLPKLRKARKALISLYY